MNIIPFDGGSKLPAYITNSEALADINKEVVSSAAFPVVSIKGKVFTVVKDGVKTIITKPDDPDEVAQHIGVVFVRANMHAKTFYLKKYSDGDSDGARPDCYSFDGKEPSPNSENPQAKKCAICPHNQWGSRTSEDGEGKGKACQDNARIAVSQPDSIEPMLLRVPPASLKPLREMLKIIAARKIPYNAVVVKLGFDREAPSPKLTFKPVGLLPDDVYRTVSEAYDGELVRGIVGLDDAPGAVTQAPAEDKPAIDTDELDAALAAREATNKASAKAKAKPAPEPQDEEVQQAAPVEEKPKASAKPRAKPAPEPQDEDAGSDKGSKLLADLDSLLGDTDD